MFEYICTSCGYQGPRKTIKKGSKAMEIAMWAIFLFPGPIYSLWRYSTREHFCPNCKKRSSMVSLRSPEGLLYMYEQERELNPEKKYEKF